MADKLLQDLRISLKSTTQQPFADAILHDLIAHMYNHFDLD